MSVVHVAVRPQGMREWKHFTIERQPAAKERFPSRQVSCVITLCHVHAEQQETVLAISRQISLLLILLGDVWCTIFQARIFKASHRQPRDMFWLAT